MTYFQAQAGELQEIIDNVRKLHTEIEKVCTEKWCENPFCSYSYCNECNYDWPCDTIKALNGDADTLERDDDHDSRRDDYLDEDLG